jgi:hypothetical protein
VRRDADRESGRGWVTGLAGAYLVLLYVGTCAVLGVFAYVQRDKIPEMNRFLPGGTSGASLTPTPTPRAHLLVNLPSAEHQVLAENFDSNVRAWGAYNWDAKVEVVNGHLLIRSNDPQYGAIAVDDAAGFGYLAGKFALQADLSTSSSVPSSFGLVFSLDGTAPNYYLFDIQASSRRFALFKHGASAWDAPIKWTDSDLIQPWPAANTLTVTFDHGTIGLYVNGAQVQTWTDPAPYEGGGFGAYLSDAGADLIVDNFFTYAGP